MDRVSGTQFQVGENSNFKLGLMVKNVLIRSSQRRDETGTILADDPLPYIRLILLISGVMVQTAMFACII